MHFGLVCIVFGVLFYSDLFTRQLVHTVRCVVGLALCTTVDFGICSIVLGDTCNIELVPIKSELKSVNQETSEKSAEISILWLPEKTTTM